MTVKLPVCEATIESSERVMADLKSGSYQEHILTNAAVPFVEKEARYLLGYSRILKSRNYQYILDCEGVTEEK